MASRSGASRTWTLDQLTVRDQSYPQAYTFTIGPLDYVGDSGDVFLHIPEVPARGAEGRPKYPEQADWVRETLLKHHIDAKEVWWSHWRFHDAGEARQFEAVLEKAGADH